MKYVYVIVAVHKLITKSVTSKFPFSPPNLYPCVHQHHKHYDVSSHVWTAALYLCSDMLNTKFLSKVTNSVTQLKALFILQQGQLFEKQLLLDY